LSDNPFSEPADDDHTVIRRSPDGTRSPTPQPPVSVSTLQPARAPTLDPSALPAISVSALTVAASPLLQLLSRLSLLRSPPVARALREHTLEQLHSFEQKARDAGIPIELLRPAHYSLCATIDDVVLNTPWGAASGWAEQTLVATLHPTVRNTDQFFEQLRQMQQAPAKFLSVIELMYLCLSHGFMGRYRQTPGDGTLDRLRTEAYTAIASQRQAADPALSRQWQGLAMPYRATRGGIPIWVTIMGAAAIGGALFFWVSTGLNAASDRLQMHALATPPASMPQLVRTALVQPLPPSPPPAEPTTIDKLRASLQPDIDTNRLSVLGTPAAAIIRIPDRAVFATGGAVVQAASLPLLARIGVVLRNEHGSVRVIDHTDNQPIRTVQFPSNFQLSTARANALRAVLARDIGASDRVSAEGRADTDPIAPNSTAEGRELNRRIDIVLYRPD
jgi:type VI secretion system protein ImpK